LPVKRHYVDLIAAHKLARQLKKENIRVLLFSIAKDNYTAGWAKTFFYTQLHIIYLQQMILGIPKKAWCRHLCTETLCLDFSFTCAGNQGNSANTYATRWNSCDSLRIETETFPLIRLPKQKHAGNYNCRKEYF
jgi:hypothetical protein